MAFKTFHTDLFLRHNEGCDEIKIQLHELGMTSCHTSWFCELLYRVTPSVVRCASFARPMPRSSSRRRSYSRRRRSPPRRRSPRRRSRSPRRSPPRRSPPRRRSSSEPRSFSPEWRQGPKRDKSDKADKADEKEEKHEEVNGEGEVSMTSGVVDGIPRSSGEATYRAEVNVPRDNGATPGPLGKRGLTAIRGPNRIDKNKARDDVKILVDAFKRGGPSEVRKTQKDLNRSWVN